MAVVGAEKQIVFLNVIQQTAVITQAATNVCLYFSFTEDIAEQVVTSYDDVTGVVTDGILDKKLVSHFAQGNQTTVIKGIDIGTSGDTRAEALATVENDWICLVTDEITTAEIINIGTYVSGINKIYNATPDILTTAADIAAMMTSITAQNVNIIASKNDQSDDARAAGKFIKLFAGSTMWANEVLNGGVDAGWIGGEQSTLDTAKVSYLAKMKGQIALTNGVAANGDPSDYVHCVLALKARLEEDITGLMIRTPKLSFADLSTLKSTIRTRTDTFEKNKALVDGTTTITTPALADVPANDVLVGKLSGVKIEVYYEYGAKTIFADLYFLV